MEVVSCIPGYGDINVETLYKPQEDYAFVNDIKAKQFIYNPYFKKEPMGPFIKELYENYVSDKILKRPMFSPLILLQKKMNTQCNPFVSYPYGVPQDIVCEKCPKCKGNKKNKKEKCKKNRKNHLKNYTFTSKLSLPNSNITSDILQINKENFYDNNEEFSIISYSQGDSHTNHFSHHEMTFSNDFESISPSAYEARRESKELQIGSKNGYSRRYNSHENYLNEDDGVYYDKDEHHYVYNGTTNLRSQIELEKMRRKQLQNKLYLKGNEHYDEQNYSDNKRDTNFHTKCEDSEEYASLQGEKEHNQIEQIVSTCTDEGSNNINGKKNQSERSAIIVDENKKTRENHKRELLDIRNEETASQQKSAHSIEKNFTHRVKEGKGVKQSIKQVKICEDENILNKYSVMESFKKHNISKEYLKDKRYLSKNSHDKQESERNKRMEHHGRVCKMGNSKYEMKKKNIGSSTNKVQQMSSDEMLSSNEEEKKVSFFPQKRNVKCRKISFEKDNNYKKKSEKRELNSKNSKLIISRTKSLKVRRGTINFPTKHNNFPLRKKSILHKQKSMVETKFKKQNTMSLKKKKTLARLNSTKQKPYTILLNKKKVINTQKSLHTLENKKNKNMQLGTRKLLARSKTKVYVDNETKIFKKAEVKMLSKSPFNPNVCTESSKISEVDNKKKEKENNTPKNKRLINAHLNTITEKVDTNSIKNKLKTKKKELFENIISLTKNMKNQPLKKKYNAKINPRDLLSLTSNNSSDTHT
ncbi:conserved Plasmodium protein, unknown function [Plasmodium ovale]|uniref:Uncharacterized protein n=2 Tax=Plasmodium ovale TaxID=36330 RepID=A0A1A8VP08_PLAOA|nr:conserved Plasmodium protein, unknown function [Plasmodium ovale curtisi]SBS82396.1 conserved Plasmodium protein, unknown function [Plasmodium ovale curtisi]SCA48571.1 conserved Plasmodium protein, unknown function [Plasmodium ovale]